MHHSVCVGGTSILRKTGRPAIGVRRTYVWMINIKIKFSLYWIRRWKCSLRWSGSVNTLQIRQNGKKAVVINDSWKRQQYNITWPNSTSSVFLRSRGRGYHRVYYCRSRNGDAIAWVIFATFAGILRKASWDVVFAIGCLRKRLVW